MDQLLRDQSRLTGSGVMVEALSCLRDEDLDALSPFNSAVHSGGVSGGGIHDCLPQQDAVDQALLTKKIYHS